MSFLQEFDKELEKGIKLLQDSEFYKSVMSGQNVEEIYKTYLRYCYHYVSLSSSFTPLAARRLDLKHLHVRKWILEHSAEELGHELMALNDLKKFGIDPDQVKKEPAPVGVVGYVSFFHYKVAIANPWSAFGVLYFLEGMAVRLAPEVLKSIGTKLDPKYKTAFTFFKEHGDLDTDHLQEQKDVLLKADLSEDDKKAIARTIYETAKMKRFMLDSLMTELKEK